MNNNKKIFTAIITCLLLSAIVFPQSGGTFVIQKSVLTGGGGQASGGAFTLDGTMGQSIAGTSSSGGHSNWAADSGAAVRRHRRQM